MGAGENGKESVYAFSLIASVRKPSYMRMAPSGNQRNHLFSVLKMAQ